MLMLLSNNFKIKAKRFICLLGFLILCTCTSYFCLNSRICHPKSKNCSNPFASLIQVHNPCTCLICRLGYCTTMIKLFSILNGLIDYDETQMTKLQKEVSL